MENRCRDYVNEHQLIKSGDHVLVAVSGGGDSVALLRLLYGWQKTMKLKLSIVHVEHGIREEDSVRDAQFVEELGKSLGIVVYRYDVDVPARAQESGRSLEEEARLARYEVFESCREKVEATSVALAHHLNDNVETILFHLIRGSNVTGLIGMRPKRGIYIRPLLQISRKEIEEYLVGIQQPYCTDVTNKSLDYDRNRIRHQVVPLLEQLNDQASLHIAEVGEQMDIMDRFLASESEKLTKAYIERRADQVIIDERLCYEEEAPMNRAIYQTLINYSGKQKDWYQIHVKGVLELLAKSVGKQIDLPYGVVARRDYDGIVLEHRNGSNRQEGILDVEIGIPGTTLIPELGMEIQTRLFEHSLNSMEIPKKDCTKWLDYAIIKGKIRLSYKKSGDFIVVHKNGGKKTLKKFFIDEKIPANKRGEQLIVREGNHCLWVLGKRLGEDVKITDKTTTILEITVGGGHFDE